MPVQAGYGAPSLDILVCCKGVFLAVETKAPGKEPTDRQEITIARMRSAGALVYVIDGDTTQLEADLKRITQQ